MAQRAQDRPKASKVYFSDLRVSEGQTLLSKLRNLVIAAGIRDIDFERKFTAIKMHFGEGENIAYLRPNWAKVIVDLVKELGGRPFLVDCNTLYPGRRKNALEHLELAYEHGFSPFSTGCNILIGDGLTGSDEAVVPVHNGRHIKEAKVGRVVMDADILISLNHFKGHVETGFGGALKNIGMGCGSRAGKMEMHSASHPKILQEGCIGCAKCSKYCASDAIYYQARKAHINAKLCISCGHCIAACPTDSIRPSFDETSELLDAKMVEYAKAILDVLPAFHISLALDISPLCDCWSSNDTPIVPDVGMFASFDPVALDLACAEAVNAQPPCRDSQLGEALAHLSRDAEHPAHTHGAHSHSCAPDPAAIDYFDLINTSSHWRTQIDHGVMIGLGAGTYELITV
ncbi:MAG: DUF362 domain-containing protein [Coriobacteriales bacterium]|jgi:uncharacterized Fe-S center protein|nr:DUF362 domain-containing protein [Coriobacteriales bacterium]